MVQSLAFPGEFGLRPPKPDSDMFLALPGESDNPQGVVQTSDGRVVRAFHRFTLVDQSGELHYSVRVLDPGLVHMVHWPGKA